MGLKDKLKQLVEKTSDFSKVDTAAVERMKRTAEEQRKAAAALRTTKG